MGLAEAWHGALRDSRCLSAAVGTAVGRLLQEVCLALFVTTESNFFGGWLYGYTGDNGKKMEATIL